MKQSVTPADVVKLLNQLTKIDPMAMHAMVNMRTLCNGKLADHETVQVQNHANGVDFEVGTLGILNGLFGVFPDGPKKGFGPITAVFNERTGRLMGFTLTPKR